MPLRILIADDHPVFRAGLRVMLAMMPRIEIIGELETSAHAVDAVLEAQPDIILMNLHIPEVGTIETIRSIVAACPQTRVLALATSREDEAVFDAMSAGARGVLLKSASQQEILVAIEAVATGAVIFCPTLAQRVIDFFSGSHSSTRPKPFSELTDREHEILDLIARGENNTAIAQRLTLSPKTVRNHISNIFTKLQISHRAHAIVLARRAGLGHDTHESGPG